MIEFRKQTVLQRHAISLALLACTLMACRRGTPAAPPPPAPLAPVSGTATIPALSAPVRVIRDRWGVPHIYARTTDDLFAAQGFVQAEDRLFQMDLWRRAVQGRLSEVLGPNFVERDAMTRRMQYRGPMDIEWASYGPDAHAIAAAFVRGINAWIVQARERLPEEFVRAGWKPELWSPEDLLNRTDAFVASGDAIAEIARRDLSDVVAEAIRRAGTAPFFATSLPRDEAASAISSSSAAHANAGSLVAQESPTHLTSPSRRYLVHLKAPGWNVIGATAPWLPGVSIGHNDRVAWAPVPIDVDTQDVYADPDTAPKTVVSEPIVIKGRKQPFVFTIDRTSHGVIVASDRAHHIAYTVRWSGMEPGGAGELAALSIDRAGDWESFRTAMARWKMPARRVVYADADGHVGFQDGALVPVRRGIEWIGWLSLDQLAHAFDSSGHAIDVEQKNANDMKGNPAAARAVFEHVLGITVSARQRFDVGPLARRHDDAPVRVAIDVHAWDRSTAMNAPGQSESPASAHFSDIAAAWSAGRSIPLAFSDAAVQANAQATLTLVSGKAP